MAKIYKHKGELTEKQQSHNRGINVLIKDQMAKLYWVDQLPDSEHKEHQVKSISNEIEALEGRLHE